MLFVGPALCVPIIFEQRDDSGYGCPEGHGRASIEDNFCSECGTKLKTVYFGKKRTIKVSEWEYSKAISETLYVRENFLSSTHQYWVPNSRKDSQPREFTYETYSLIDSQNFNVEEEKKWFAEAFKEEIDKAKELYGSAEVSWIVFSS